jgi:hypothetical protein
MIKFVSDLRQVSGFFRYACFFHHEITEILLKVVLNTIKPNQAKLYIVLYSYVNCHVFFFISMNTRVRNQSCSLSQDALVLLESLPGLYIIFTRMRHPINISIKDEHVVIMQ